MLNFTAAELAGITSGELTAAPPGLTVKGFFVDSREAIAGGVFVAIKGERTDGHQFLSDIHAANVGLAIIDVHYSGVVPAELPVLRVKDPVIALGQIAHWARVTKLQAQVIAVTGSSGKTTTKDFIAGILSDAGPTIWAKGSFNTEVGLPLTILGADETTKFLVLEMGMRGIGHIELLSKIALPNVGVVTNIGSAHMQLLGSRESIASAKGELIRSLSPDSWAVLNEDDSLVRAMSSSSKAQVVTFGESASAQFRAKNVQVDNNARCSYMLEYLDRSYPVSLRIPGEHQVANSLAALAAATCAGVPIAQAVQALNEIAHISKWRMEVVTTTDGVTVINDSYNANPESMRAALKTLAAMSVGRRSIAVLGPMRELGDAEREEHDALGRMAVRLDISLLVCVGDTMKITHLGASQEGSWGEESQWVPDIDAAIDFLRERIEPGDVVLVKASRSVGLERVADALLAGKVSKVSEEKSEGAL